MINEINKTSAEHILLPVHNILFENTDKKTNSHTQKMEETKTKNVFENGKLIIDMTNTES